MSAKAKERSERESYERESYEEFCRKYPIDKKMLEPILSNPTGDHEDRSERNKAKEEWLKEKEKETSRILEEERSHISRNIDGKRRHGTISPDGRSIQWFDDVEYYPNPKPKHHKVPKGRTVIVIEEVAKDKGQEGREQQLIEAMGIYNENMILCIAKEDIKAGDPVEIDLDRNGFPVNLEEWETARAIKNLTRVQIKLGMDTFNISIAAKGLKRTLTLMDYKRSRQLMLVELNKCIDR